MITWKITDMNTGAVKGTVKAKTLEGAEQQCLDKNINIYDDYMLISGKITESASQYINQILER